MSDGGAQATAPWASSVAATLLSRGCGSRERRRVIMRCESHHPLVSRALCESERADGRRFCGDAVPRSGADRPKSVADNLPGKCFSGDCSASLLLSQLKVHPPCLSQRLPAARRRHQYLRSSRSAPITRQRTLRWHRPPDALKVSHSRYEVSA